MTGVCGHGFLDGRGCQDCDQPLDGRPAAVLAVVLAVALVVVVVAAHHWIGDRIWPDDAPKPAAVAGVWCGQADEAVALHLTQDAGRLNGELRLGGRPPMPVAGRVEGGGVVTLRTVGSALWFELDGALVEGRLRLDVTDDAGDTGRVELQRC